MAGEVSLDAADDFFLGFALGCASGDVVAGGLVVAHAYESDPPEGAVGFSVPGSVEAVALLFAGRGVDG